MRHTEKLSVPVQNAALVLQHMGFDITQDQMKGAIGMFLASAKNLGLSLEKHCKCGEGK